MRQAAGEAADARRCHIFLRKSRVRMPFTASAHDGAANGTRQMVGSSAARPSAVCRRSSWSPTSFYRSRGDTVRCGRRRDGLMAISLPTCPNPIYVSPSPAAGATPLPHTAPRLHATNSSTPAFPTRTHADHKVCTDLSEVWGSTHRQGCPSRAYEHGLTRSRSSHFAWISKMAG